MLGRFFNHKTKHNPLNKAANATPTDEFVVVPVLGKTPSVPEVNSFESVEFKKISLDVVSTALVVSVDFVSVVFATLNLSSASSASFTSDAT